MTSDRSPDRVISHHLLGRLGEQYVAGELVLRGAPVESGGPADLLIHGTIPVEVKTARYLPYRRGPRRGYQFCLRRRGHCDFHGQYLILLCWDTPPVDLHCFIIPGHEIDGQRKLVIPSRPEAYEGQWQPYLDLWDLVT